MGAFLSNTIILEKHLKENNRFNVCYFTETAKMQKWTDVAFTT